MSEHVKHPKSAFKTALTLSRIAQKTINHLTKYHDKSRGTLCYVHLYVLG